MEVTWVGGREQVGWVPEGQNRVARKDRGLRDIDQVRWVPEGQNRVGEKDNEMTWNGYRSG